MTRFAQPRASQDRLSKIGRALAVTALVAGTAFIAKPADAWWRGGVWIGLPPVVVGPAYYPPYPYYPYYPYYPPGYYAPPPAAPALQAQGNAAPAEPGKTVAYGTVCHAGVYSCPAPYYTPIGKTCACPGIGALSYGTVN